MENKLKYLVALNHFPKFGPLRLKKLKNFFSNWQLAYQASSQELIRAGIENNISQEFIAARIMLDPDKLLERLNAEKINFITPDDPTYPKLLAEIYNLPQIIYYRGQIENINEYSLSIIGSRKFSPYGRQVTEQLTRDLVLAGFSIISGLALGIDSIAHEITLENGGFTVAVLGSGIDRQNIYPSANRYLADKIIDSGGVILSEFPLGTPPLKHHFPQRNRIIAGLSRATIVVEAGEKSGALITAEYALEQNREVFAVPGSIYSPASIGPNRLIRRGAAAVTSTQDVIEVLDLPQVINFIENKKIIPDTPEESLVINQLSSEPIHLNDLVRLTGLDTSVINSTLVIMEMKGMAKNVGGLKYVIGR